MFQDKNVLHCLDSPQQLFWPYKIFVLDFTYDQCDLKLCGLDGMVRKAKKAGYMNTRSNLENVGFIG